MLTTSQSSADAPDQNASPSTASVFPRETLVIPFAAVSAVRTWQIKTCNIKNKIRPDFAAVRNPDAKKTIVSVIREVKNVEDSASAKTVATLIRKNDEISVFIYRE